MACHELAGLRLGLMNVIGIDDANEKQHELNEIGAAADSPGPIAPLIRARNLMDLKKHYELSLIALAEKVSKLSDDDPKMSYYRSLLITTKKVEMELNRMTDNFEKLYEELDEVHHYIHEIFPK